MRRLTAVAVASLLLNLVLLGWLGWIVADPHYWFPGAYAEKGPTGDKGPRGPRGPVGPPGPVGPDAFDAVSSLEAEILDVSSRLDDLESAAGSSELQTQVDDLQVKLDNICEAISLNYVYSNSAIEEFVTDLYGAC